MSTQKPLISCSKCGARLIPVDLETPRPDVDFKRDQTGIFVLCPEESCRHKNYVSFEEESQCLVCRNDLIQPQRIGPGEDVEFTGAGLEGDTLFFRCPSCGKRNAIDRGRVGFRVVKALD